MSDPVDDALPLIDGRGAGRRSRRSGTIDRETAIGVAVQIADEQGLAAVTMRAVATGLGVTPMSLYWHFADKQGLLAAMARQIGDEIQAYRVAHPPPAGADLYERLRAMTVAPVRVLLDHHPDITELVRRQLAAYERVATDERSLDGYEQLLAVLAEAGILGSEAIRWAVLIAQESLMLASVCRSADPSGDADESMRAHWLAMRDVDAERYPSLSAALARLGETRDQPAETLLDAGLDMIVASVRERARDR